MIRTAALRSNSPIRYLSIAWLITLATLGAFLWCAYDSYRRFTDTAQRNLRIEELRGQIIYLDEVLTMSARMFALTADPSWEARYRQFEPKLDHAIREAMSHSLGAQMTKETDEANATLVALENRALELARLGKLDEAKAALFSEQYTTQKATYREGMDKLGRQLADAAAAAVQSERRRIYFQLAGGAAIIGLLTVGWLIVVRLANQGLHMRQELDKIERDLDIAREIQRGLLPRDIPDTPGFEIEGWSKPADQTGGDYFDWMELPDGGTLITLADVSGHGIGPALIVAVCRAYMRAATAGNGVALESAISRVNDLLQMDIPDERFVTAAVGVLRPQANEMTLVSAGQAPLFFYRAASRTVENWAADDLPLGVLSGVSFDGARRIRFEPGDTLVLTTDGFFEWSNGAGEQFGIERLEAFVAAHAHEPPSEFIGALHADVVAHAAGQKQPDDLTVVIVKRSS
jgi:serine phosphatase RsbU (regulator of sigma subunit)